VIGSTGTLLIAVAGWQADTLTAAIYYLVHSTLAGAALFLVADVVARRRASFADTASAGPVFCQQQTVGLMFMAAAIAATGLPPLSGFIGKLLILESIVDTPGWQSVWGWAWGVILATTLIGVIGFARTGSAIFWKDIPPTDGAEPAVVSSADMVAPIITLALLAAWSIGAGAGTAYGAAAADQILDSASAVRAVLGEP